MKASIKKRVFISVIGFMMPCCASEKNRELVENFNQGITQEEIEAFFNDSNEPLPVAEKNYLVERKNTRKFACELCDKSYDIKKSLYSHMFRIHNQKEKSICTICNKVYELPDSLAKHMKRKHSENAKPFICGYCVNRAFCTRRELTNHCNSSRCKRRMMAEIITLNQ